MFLIDGVPDGRIACELSNWTGKAYRLPRALLKEAAGRPELYKAGIYLLFGPDAGNKEIARAYIGEAEEVLPRLVQQQSREFWSEAVAFISKDENLNKAHVKFLEYQLHQEAMKAKRYALENGNTPQCPAISEMERAVMTEFFENVILLVGALGYRVFNPLAARRDEASEIFYVQGPRGANGRAILSNEGVVVLEGSEVADATVPSIHEWGARLRESLISDGTIALKDGRLVFTQDHLFPSPSAAAVVILGRSAAGPREWANAKGVPLREFMEA